MSGARQPEDFAAWQLAWELKERVFAFTETAPASRDRKFCEGVRDAARSAPDNIAEGFYRFAPHDFASFCRIAKGSLGEVRNQLRHAHAQKYLTDHAFGELFHLASRAIRAVTGLRNYLLSCPKDFDPRKLDTQRGTRNPEPRKEPGTS